MLSLHSLMYMNVLFYQIDTTRLYLWLVFRIPSHNLDIIVYPIIPLLQLRILSPPQHSHRIYIFLIG